MYLTILGKYGPFPKEGGATSSYLLKSERSSVVFEMGAGGFSRLKSVCEPSDLKAVIISHLHYDHISDLGVFNYYLESLSRKGVFNSKIRLIVPRSDCVNMQYISAMKFFEIDFVDDGEERVVEDIRFKFFSSNHPVKSLGFVACSNGKKFLYSSDSDVCKSLEDNVKGVNLALLDGAFLPSQYTPGKPHMSVECCAKIAKENSVRCIVTHLLPDNDEQNYIKFLEDCILAEEMKSYEV